MQGENGELCTEDIMGTGFKPNMTIGSLRFQILGRFHHGLQSDGKVLAVGIRSSRVCILEVTGKDNAALNS